MRFCRIGLRVFAAIGSVVLITHLFGCAAKSGTRVSTDNAALQSVNSVHLTVTASEPFTIRRSDNNTGANVGAAFGLVGVLVGAGIDAARMSSKSGGMEDAVSVYSKTVDAKAILAEKTRQALLQSQRFSQVDVAPASNGTTADGQLTLTIEDWGLRSCVGGSSVDHMQVAIHVDGKFVSKTGGKTIWERDELFLDSDCRHFEEFRVQQGLLVERLNQSLEGLAGTLVNRILYP